MRRLLAVIGFASACAGSSPPGVHDLGALGKPAIVTARDGGAAGRIGGRMLWTFGDTLMAQKGADGRQLRSATAAWGDGTSLALDEALDAAGAPLQLLPFTVDEQIYNDANGPMERFALWPGCVVPAADGTALVFFSNLKVHPGTLNYEPISTGLAHVALGSTVATRDPAPLFVAPEHSYALGGVIDAGLVHLYACEPTPGALDTVCRVVRAPLGDVATPAAWQAFDGTTWSSDLARAQPVLHGPPGDLSVSWNPALGRFLAVYSGVFSNDVFLRTAPRPEGPWSDSRRLFSSLAPPTGNNYAAKEHPELAESDGRTLVVSFARPLGGFSGEVRLVKMSLP